MQRRKWCTGISILLFTTQVLWHLPAQTTIRLRESQESRDAGSVQMSELFRIKKEADDREKRDTLPAQQEPLSEIENPSLAREEAPLVEQKSLTREHSKIGEDTITPFRDSAEKEITQVPTGFGSPPPGGMPPTSDGVVYMPRVDPEGKELRKPDRLSRLPSLQVFEAGSRPNDNENPPEFVPTGQATKELAPQITVLPVRPVHDPTESVFFVKPSPILEEDPLPTEEPRRDHSVPAASITSVHPTAPASTSPITPESPTPTEKKRVFPPSKSPEHRPEKAPPLTDRYTPEAIPPEKEQAVKTKEAKPFEKKEKSETVLQPSKEPHPTSSPLPSVLSPSIGALPTRKPEEEKNKEKNNMEATPEKVVIVPDIPPNLIPGTAPDPIPEKKLPGPDILPSEAPPKDKPSVPVAESPPSNEKEETAEAKDEKKPVKGEETKKEDKADTSPKRTLPEAFGKAKELSKKTVPLRYVWKIEPVTDVYPTSSDTPKRKSSRHPEEKRTFSQLPKKRTVEVRRADFGRGSVSSTDPKRKAFKREIPKREKAWRDIPFKTTVNGGSFIQIASFREKKNADAAIESKAIRGVPQKEKLFVYKSEGSRYYKFLVGPFRHDEIGVQMLKLHDSGFLDSFVFRP